MDRTRAAAVALAKEGRLRIEKKGQVLDPKKPFRGRSGESSLGTLSDVRRPRLSCSSPTNYDMRLSRNHTTPSVEIEMRRG